MLAQRKTGAIVRETTDLFELTLAIFRLSQPLNNEVLGKYEKTHMKNGDWMNGL